MCLLSAPSAHAGLTWYGQNFAGWQDAAGEYSTCDFVGFAPLTVIDDEYAAIGVHFTNPSPNLVKHIAVTFPQDEWGIDGNGEYVEVVFDVPMHAVGAHIPGIARFQLFLGDTMIGQTPFPFGSGPNKFAGVTSTLAFDRVRLVAAGTGNQVYIDNLYFSTVPAPQTGLLLGAFAVVGRRRRR